MVTITVSKHVCGPPVVALIPCVVKYFFNNAIVHMMS